MKLLKIVGLATLSSALALGAASAQGKKWDTVKIATEGAYAPWNFTSAGGKLEGFEIDLANELCTRMKAKCEIVAQDWDGIIPALTAKKYDAIMAGMNATDERRKVIDFSMPYAVGPNGYLVEKSSPLAKMPGTGKVFDLVKQKAEAQKAIDEVKPLLKGKTVGVQVATNHANFADPSTSRAQPRSANTRPPSSTTSTSPRAASTPFSQTRRRFPRRRTSRNSRTT